MTTKQIRYVYVLSKEWSDSWEGVYRSLEAVKKDKPGYWTRTGTNTWCMVDYSTASGRWYIKRIAVKG